MEVLNYYKIFFPVFPVSCDGDFFSSTNLDKSEAPWIVLG